MLKIILSFSFLLGFAASGINAASAAIVTTKELASIEAEFQKKIQSKDLDEKRKFYAYLLAGRELYQYRFFEKSEIYYEDSKKVNISEDKSEAYINLIAIALVEKNKEKMQKQLDSAMKYFEDNKKFKKAEIDYYLNSVSSYLNGKTAKPVKGYYGKFVQEENLVAKIKSKEYEQALSSLNPESLSESKNSFEITIYDSLNVLIHKKNVAKLYCAEDYKKYPDSYSYSMLVCGLLSDYLKKGNFDKKRLVRAEKFFNEEAPDKKYILEMVKEIK